MAEATKRMRVPDLIEKKKRGEKIVMLTAYDFTMARILDRAGDRHSCWWATRSAWWCWAIETTLPVTLDAMVHHTAAVSRGARRALVVADMPFLTCQVSVRRRRAQRGPPGPRRRRRGGEARRRQAGHRRGRPPGGHRHSGHGPPGPDCRSRCISWAATGSRPRTRATLARLVKDALALEAAGRVRHRAGVDSRRRPRARSLPR